MFRTGGFAAKLDAAIEKEWWDAFCHAWWPNGEDCGVDQGVIDDDAPQYVEAAE